MRMKQLVSRAKKYAKIVRARKARRARVAVLSAAVGVGLVTVVGAAMMGSPARDAAMPQAQRLAENRRAQEELAAPAADYAAATSKAAAAPKPGAVTLTGCLAQHDATFQLKDVAGADVPHSRSWKSGFLKARPAPIDIVDAGRRLRLQDHLGERVALTGDLDDRELHARSLRRVAAACN